MVNPDVIGKKLAKATSWIDSVEESLSRPADEFLSDRESKDLASFHLFLAIQECINLGCRWVADKGWGSPDDAMAMFDVLAVRGAIDHRLAKTLRSAVALHDQIAHSYWTVDHERLQVEYREGLGALWQFLALVADEAGLEIEHRPH
jgi:uncharacterized protein YutE (UPF0331/DUF86 family)